MDNLEYRYCELRSNESEIKGTIISFGDVANRGLFTEEFIKDSVKYDDVIVNIAHDRTKPVARLGSSLEIEKRDNQLTAIIKPPDTTYGRDVRAMVDAGILRGLSMEFFAVEDRWEGQHRIVEKAELHGIGVVDNPSYAKSQIEKRWKEWNDGNIIIPGNDVIFYY